MQCRMCGFDRSLGWEDTLEKEMGTHSSILARNLMNRGAWWATVNAAAAAKSLQSCSTLSNPMDCSLQGSSVHGIFQARVLEWVAIAFSDSQWGSQKS